MLALIRKLIYKEKQGKVGQMGPVVIALTLQITMIN